MEVLIPLIFWGISILGSIFWIWMIIDCATKESSEGKDKLVWIIIIVFTHLIGAAIYFFVKRQKRTAELGREATMNLPSPDDGRPRHLLEDIFIILCIVFLWPVILGWTHPIYEILLYSALVGLVIIFFRRIKRFNQARDELQ